MLSRALFNTRRALSYVSNFANANHNYQDHHYVNYIIIKLLNTSTLRGQHSTALLSKILASSGSSSSTKAFHSLTELGMFSRAVMMKLESQPLLNITMVPLRNTFFLADVSTSSSVALIQTFTDCGKLLTARAITALACSGG